MDIISLWRVRDFVQQYPDASGWLYAWLEEAKRANWKNTHEITERFGNARSIGGKRVIFNIRGNKYRMIVEFDYIEGTGDIRFLDTHKKYDRVDAKEV